MERDSGDDISIFVDRLDDMYKNEIKPFIKKGEYATAGGMLLDAKLFSEMKAREIGDYSSGINFMASLDSFTEDLRRGRGPRMIQEFEAYLAQIKLSIESGNKFHLA